MPHYKDNPFNGEYQGEKVVDSESGYSCPNCGGMISDKTLVERSEPEFVSREEPAYIWYELHKCERCETYYSLQNGT